MARKIILEVTFRAESQSDEYIPADTMAEETVMLTIPNLESKYVIFPKVLEGVTIGVIRSHLAKVGAYLNKIEADERRRREFEQLQIAYPDAALDEDHEAEDDDEGMALDSDGDGEEVMDNYSAEIMVDLDQIAEDAQYALRAAGDEVELPRVQPEVADE